MGFTKFGLTDHVMKGVSAAGYTTPTPIQSLAIRPALEGRDIIGCAQTGTGKTAAFVLPLLHRLATEAAIPRRDHLVRALVITPTRELAHQIQEAASTYGRFLTLRSIAIYGGVNMEQQVSLLRRGADIVIATPGRLLDHMQRGTIALSQVRMLVLDEADRMLDMGFIHDVRKIIGALPKERQTLLFSATMSPEIRSLAAGILRDPAVVEAGERRSPAETIRQHFYGATPESKVDLLFHVIEKERMESVLVFARTKHGADKVCRRLERQGMRAVAIHSNRTQAQREKALAGFREGRFRVMVATDIAARGIDVEGISHVINYDIPHYAEDYIHRIGRTGRAGLQGDAITFVARDDEKHLKGLEKFTGRHYTVKPYPDFTPPARPQHEPKRETARGTPPAARGPKQAQSPKPQQKQQPARRKISNEHPPAYPPSDRRRPGRHPAPQKKGRPSRQDGRERIRKGGGWSNY